MLKSRNLNKEIKKAIRLTILFLNEKKMLIIELIIMIYNLIKQNFIDEKLIKKSFVKNSEIFDKKLDKKSSKNSITIIERKSNKKFSTQFIDELEIELNIIT